MPMDVLGIVHFLRKVVKEKNKRSINSNSDDDDDDDDGGGGGRDDDNKKYNILLLAQIPNGTKNCLK